MSSPILNPSDTQRPFKVRSDTSAQLSTNNKSPVVPGRNAEDEDVSNGTEQPLS